MPCNSPRKENPDSQSLPSACFYICVKYSSSLKAPVMSVSAYQDDIGFSLVSKSLISLLITLGWGGQLEWEKLCAHHPRVILIEIFPSIRVPSFETKVFIFVPNWTCLLSTLHGDSVSNGQQFSGISTLTQRFSSLSITDFCFSYGWTGISSPWLLCLRVSTCFLGCSMIDKHDTLVVTWSRVRWSLLKHSTSISITKATLY